MTTRLIHVYLLEPFYLCCGSGVNQMSLRVIGVKSLSWYHFYNTLSWAWAVAGWETTLSRARPVAGWETELTGASHWIVCSYANPQCQIWGLLFLKLYNVRFHIPPNLPRALGKGAVSSFFLYRRMQCACILFFYGSFFLSFFFCQPYNLMYLRVALIDFNETWSQWSMT